MADGHRYIAILTTILLLWVQDAFASPVLVEVEGGNTAFVVDVDADQAFWLVDDCKRPLPLKTNADSRLVTDTLSDNVQLGGRNVNLRQQFRFDMDAPVSLEIYNSVRGGWAPVPVRVDTTCHQSAECRTRMELPACSGG